MVLYKAVDRQRQHAKGVHLCTYLLQSTSTLEKEMRNAIDEVCCKTKLPAVGV